MAYMLKDQTNLGEMHPSALPQAAVQGDRSEPAPDALSGGPQTQHVDVLIVGAGLFGIGAACYLQTHCPTKSFAILEARQTLGGTKERYSGRRLASICWRFPSRKGGNDSFSPSISNGSSTAKPGPCVAISNRMPFGSRKYRLRK